MQTPGLFDLGAHKLMINSVADPVNGDAWRAAYLDAIKSSLQNSREGALDEIVSYLQKQKTPPTQEEFLNAIGGILGTAYSVR